MGGLGATDSTRFVDIVARPFRGLASLPCSRLGISGGRCGGSFTGRFVGWYAFTLSHLHVGLESNIAAVCGDRPLQRIVSKKAPFADPEKSHHLGGVGFRAGVGGRSIAVSDSGDLSRITLARTGYFGGRGNRFRFAWKRCLYGLWSFWQFCSSEPRVSFGDALVVESKSGVACTGYEPDTGDDFSLYLGDQVGEAKRGESQKSDQLSRGLPVA